MRKPFFTCDWAAPIRATWPKLVFPLLPPEPLNWLELGSFEGRSALWLVDNLLYHPFSKIHCVDKWDRRTPPDPNAGYDYEGVFDENTRDIEQIIKRKGSSSDVLPTFSPRQFNGCYIDSSHEYEDVLRDARMALPLMKPGGVIIFNSYECLVNDGVRLAVQKLFHEWKHSAKIVNIDYQVIFQGLEYPRSL